MKRLHDFFQEERNRELLVSPAEINRFMEERATGFAHDDFASARAEMIRVHVGSHRSWKSLLAGAVGVAITAGLIGLFLPEGEVPNRERRISSVLSSLESSPAKRLAVNSENQVGEKGADYQEGEGWAIENSSTDLPERSNQKKEREKEAENQMKGNTLPAPFISAMRMMELSGDELARLGIQLTGFELAYFYHYNNHDDSAIVGGAVFPFDAAKPVRNPGIAQPPFHPRWVYGVNPYGWVSFPTKEEIAESDGVLASIIERRAKGLINEEEQGELLKKFIQSFEQENQRRIELGMLVPIYVKIDSSINSEEEKGGPREVYFWYEPTPEFLAALPERVRIPLERELRLAALLKGKLENESVETFVGRQSPEIREAFDSLKSEGGRASVSAVAGDGIIGIFNAASGAITSSSVSPNPAREQAVLRYRLGAPRTVVPALYNVRGSLVKVFEKPTLQDAGEHHNEIDLKDIPPGLYLLVIGTDRGERAIQRVIVR